VALKSNDEVVAVADDDDVAVRFSISPLPDPQGRGRSAGTRLQAAANLSRPAGFRVRPHRDRVAPRQGPARIEWRDVFWGDRYGAMRQAEKPYQNGRLLEGETLYLALDRPDLAEAYRNRQQGRTGLGTVGTILIAGGAIAARAAKDDQRSSDGPVLAGGAVISIIFGAVLAIAGVSTPADVVTDAELHHLVDVHNSSP